MKKIILPFAIGAIAVFSSCTMSRDARIAQTSTNNKLLPAQEMTHNKPAPVSTASAVTVVVPEDQALAQCRPPEGTVNKKNKTTVKPKPKNASSVRSMVNRVNQNLASAVTIPNLERQGQNIFKKHTATAAAPKQGQERDMDYHKLWIVCLIAAVVLSILSFLLVHIPIISLLISILLLIAVLGFIIFLALWLYDKHGGNSGE